MKNTKAIMCAVCVLCAAGLFAQNGVISEVSGTVELKPAGAGSFVPAKAGDTVAPNTVVSTGFKSTAVITAGSSVILVRPLTRLSLTEIQAIQGTETINMNLQTGRVRVDVKPPAGARAEFTTKSPMATASVRGTSFEFDTRNLTVREGTVGFRGNRGMPVLVGAGEASRAGTGSGAADPFAVQEAELTVPLPSGASEGTGGSAASATWSYSLSFDFVQ